MLPGFKYLQYYVFDKLIQTEEKIRSIYLFLMILDFIFKHIPILKQLPDFSSCCAFGTNPGFETITGFQHMTRFWNIS